MSAAFDVGRVVTLRMLHSFFSALQRETRSPSFEKVPYLASAGALICTDTLQGQISGWGVEDRETLIKRIAFPLIAGFGMGLAVCAAKDYSLKTWTQDFAISGVAFALCQEIRYRKDLSLYKKGLYIDILMMISQCAVVALDKSRNPTLPFTAHSAHFILTTVTSRILWGVADKYEWFKDEKHVRDATIRKVMFIALIFPVQGILETKLHYNWKVIGIDFVVHSVAAYALFSPTSPLVQRYSQK
jgi:hypothetical protein